MKYWALGRALGLSESEFWAANYAMIAALYRVIVLEWQQRRDYFPAQLIAFKATTQERTWTVGEVLRSQYPRLPESVTGYTAGPEKADRGALGDWRVLKGNMKAVTKKRTSKKGTSG